MSAARGDAGAARAAGFRVALRDAAGPLEEVALEGPDVVVLELPAEAGEAEESPFAALKRLKQSS